MALERCDSTCERRVPRDAWSALDDRKRTGWGLDRSVCDALLGALVEAKFLFDARGRVLCAPTRGRQPVNPRI